MRQYQRLLGVGLWMIMGLAAITANATPTRNIYIVAGPSSVFHAPVGHDYYPSSQIWTNRLVQRNHNIKVNLLQGWPSDPSVFTNADAIVLYSEGGCDHATGEIYHEIMRNGRWDKAMQVINRGVSFGTVHYAIEPSGAPQNWPGLGWSTGQYGTNEFVQWLGGYYAGWYSVSPSPSWNNLLNANLSFPSHPANPGISYNGQSFQDEWYANIYFGQTVQPFLQLDNHPNGGGLQTVGWTRDRADGARGFAWTGGHYTPGDWASSPETYSNMDLLLDVIEWVGRVGDEDHHQLVIHSGETWKYDADGSMDANWSTTGFNDGTWSSGVAPLGYDDWNQDWIATQVAAGSAGNRPVTTWYRKSFNVPTLANVTNFLVKINADDGAVVYLNGTEIGRYNMPGGAVTPSTVASNSLEVNWNTTFDTVCPYTQSQWDNANQGQKDAWTAEYNARNVAMTNSSTPEFYWGRIYGLSALQSGSNVLAVEVHQKDTSNPDMRFDVEADILGNSSYYPTNGPAVPYLGINNSGASNMTASGATVYGNLFATNSTSTYTWVYYGTVDGGTNKAAWQHSVAFGVSALGTLSTTLSGLTGETPYYYRFYASNVVSDTWASPSDSFTTTLDLSAYAYKMKITFKGYNQVGTLTNFPALVALNTGISSFSYSQFQSTNGNDLRFANSLETVLLSHEVEQWNTGGTSYVWVNVPAIASSNDYIWAYWGHPGAAGQIPASQTNGLTWNTDYAAVFHLNETSGNNRDSTANRNDGTRNNNTSVAGVVCNAQSFNGSSAFIEVPNSPSLSANSITFEFWMKPDANVGAYSRPLSKNFVGYGGKNGAWGLQMDGDPTKIDIKIANDGPDATGYNQKDGNWHYIAAAGQPVSTVGAEVGRFYMDGIFQSAFTHGIYGTTSISNDSHLHIGCEVEESGGGGWFNGLIDEVRVSKVVRSAPWLWASCITAKSNALFTGYGAVSATASTPTIGNAAASSVTTNSATLNGSLTSTGGAPTQVWVYWGTSDAGATTAGWAGSGNLGVGVVGSLSTNVGGLNSSTTYYYRFSASNSFGMTWGTPAISFTTLTISTSSAPTVANSAANAVTTNTETLNGTLVSTGGAPTQVWVYWGTSDAGATTVGWTGSASFGIRAAGGLATNVSGLSANTTYYYRFYASNSVGVSWASPATNFTTLPLASNTLPVIGNLGATAVATNTAQLNGSLTATGGVATTVSVYWGTSDAGATTVGWSWNASLGPQSAGVVATNVSGLSANTTYYYRYYASNSVGGAWASSASSFTTLTVANTNPVSAFANSMKVSFSGYSAPGTLTNFPVLVVLNTGIANFSYSQFQSTNGYDLNFTDASGTNVLPYEVEKWNTGGSSFVWVSVPALATSSNYIWAQWGNPAATQMLASQTNGATWNAGYAAVYHLNETAGNNRDSTANRNDGVRNNNTGVAGVIGNAQSFNGSSAFIEITNSASLQMTAVTFELWMKPDVNVQAYSRPLSKNFVGYGGKNSAWGLQMSGDPSMIDIKIANDGPDATAYNEKDGNWHYIAEAGQPAGSIGAEVGRFYMNGLLQNVFTRGTFGTASIVNDSHLHIGCEVEEPGGGGFYNGLIDEVRVSSVVRGSNWLWATDMTMASNALFTTYAAVVTTAPPVVSNNTVSAIALTTATANGLLASSGGATTAGWLYWGTANGGTTKSAWGYSVSLGTISVGPISAGLSSLLPETTYYYTFYASNSAGNGWAAPSIAFTTLVDPVGDSNSNGIPNSWEQHFFGSSTGTSAVADSDGDGQSNFREYMAGTDPTNPASVFRVVGIVMSNGVPQLTWTGGTNGPSSPYVVECRSLLGTGGWWRLGTQARVSGINTWPTPASNSPALFYRVAATN